MSTIEILGTLFKSPAIFSRKASNVPMISRPVVETASVFSCLVIFLILVSTSVTAYPLDGIESCLLNEDQLQQRRSSNKKIPPLFHLHFGDPAVEILNALNSSDIRRIEALRKCVELEDSSLCEDAK